MTEDTEETIASDDLTDAETEAEFPGGGMPDPAALLAYLALQMPTADLFRSLVPVADGHAWRSLGMVSGINGIQVDLPMAQVSIDLYALALGKALSLFSPEEAREAQRRLSDLRMNFLSVSKENSGN